ncbi:efflux transporter outer membrane subunit [Telmatospirillum sp. J64-1]|uniref:efflux transporter outer membrane subunit n=1 Tax=Telmatospirillum sp. J64-1 TaxID=2502183 RepID=UPI00115CD1AC|nr:efflux transporter outer membrane subunit [Telmatospirillum sp. J64-1]
MATNRPLLLAVAMAFAVGGCAPQTLGERPAVAVPAAWTSGGQQGVAAVPDASWWTAFESPELTRLLDQAAANNPDLAASRQRIAQAIAQVEVAGAGLLPTLDGSGSATRNWSGEGRTSNAFRLGLSAAYEVDVWGRNRYAAEAAEASYAASEFDHRAAELSLAAQVATAYFQYLSANDRIANARRILAIAERVLSLVETRESFGTASGLDLAQQRLAVASLRANLPSLEQSRVQTRNALAALLGLPPQDLALEGESLQSISLPAISPGIPAEVLERRPDLRRAEAQLVAAQANLGAARAAMFPSIRLTGSTGYSSDELANLFSPSGLISSLAAGLTAPLFDGNRLAGQRDAAEAREAEVVANYRSAVISAFQDVEDALAAVRFSDELQRAQEASAVQARQAYELAEVRYRTGAIDFLSVLDAQRSLFQQEDALEQVRLARLTSVVGLYRALGGAW